MTEPEQSDGKNIQRRQLNQLVKMVHGLDQTLKKHGFEKNSSEAWTAKFASFLGLH